LGSRGTGAWWRLGHKNGVFGCLKRDIGTGSTSASTAQLQYEIDVPLRALLKQVGSVAATRSGKKVSTPAAGNVATVNQLLSEEKAPEISFRVHDGLGIIQLHENWMN
jgi:hypothetical protein